MADVLASGVSVHKDAGTQGSLGHQAASALNAVVGLESEFGVLLLMQGPLEGFNTRLGPANS